MDAQYVERLHALLQQSNVPDTNQLREATEGIKAASTQQQFVPALFEILASSPDLAVRQLAAVEMRKRIHKKPETAWVKQAVDVRTGIKARLLDLLPKEESTLVRNAISRVVSEIANRELIAGTWPELLPFLFAAADSPNASHRQIAIFVFYTVLETLVDGGEKLEAYLPQILAIFAKSLQDPESIEVRITTVRALGKVAQNLEDDSEADRAQVQAAIPQMVRVLHDSLEQSHTDGVKQCLDVFESLCMLDDSVLANAIPDLIEFFLNNGANTTLEEDLRIMCFNSLIWACQYKQNVIKNQKLAKPIIERLMTVAVEDEGDDYDEDTPSRLALRVIDGLSTSLPPAQVFPPLHEQMQAYMGHADGNHRKAALMAFGVAVEGCSEYIRPHIDQLWPFIEAGLRDPEVVVRKAACVAIGCLCESLDDECAKRHAVLLPMIMELINHEETQRSACTALDSLLEVMGEDISQYLPAIMERLAGLLETAPIPVKSTVTGAIGSAAHASKEGFLPYFPQTLQRMLPHLLLTEEGDQMDLRGITTDAIGTFAEAVGKEAFRPYFQDLMNHNFESMKLENPRLRECAFIFFAVMARVFGEEFAPFLPHVAPLLLGSFKQSEHDAVPGASGDGIISGAGVGTNASGEYTTEDDGDEEFIDLDDLNDAFANVNSAIAVEKEVAADSIGEIFTHTKHAFLPYLQESVEQLGHLLEHFYQGIRKSAVAALFACINTLNEMSNPSTWQPGLTVQVPLNSDVQNLVNTVIPALLDAWNDEDDRTTAIEFCQSLAECLNKNGPAIISQHADRVCNFAAEILDQKSLAQIDNDPSEDEAGAEDISEYESVLIGAAMDLVGAMSHVFAQDFLDPLRALLPKVTKYYSPSRSTTDRGAAVASLGEIIIGMKGAITPLTGDILTTLSRALQDEEPAVRSNAAFASGVLIEHSEQDLSEHFGALLNAIRPMFEVPAGTDKTDILNARDNACGCLSRMIIRKPDAVPLDQALPILFSSMPLKEDMAEWTPVFKMLITLLQANNPVAMQHIDTILGLFAHTLGDASEPLDPQLRGTVVAFVSSLNASVPDKVAAAGLTQFLV
ncbi:arm repeat-containing protein [Ceraceosorus bombacis]|uniref:Arm repeat-containing protein n=1 Tax=Ceraceosorus bombacis TaxID=401625 RepID=A0A0P1BN27_9BASI|nr:arm repeat-containing protein [Ceraceosorus bombacis]